LRQAGNWIASEVQFVTADLPRLIQINHLNHNEKQRSAVLNS
jgi:hypothetical protein